ncbi:cytochrome P450 [Podospora didyma]|uniref:Cytochrome P450 n=1 Tax=Podospora didyma TaxID=330526 RepID=A0AAE0NUG5_9PEZI|nr:cytochrome P450 [Podospora didyma]
MAFQRLDMSMFHLESFSALNLPLGVAISPQTVALLVVLGFIGKWALDYHAQSKIPAIGYSSIPISFLQTWTGSKGFMRQPIEFMKEGYRKHKASIFRIAMPDQEWMIVADQAKITEYLSAPDDVISMDDSLFQTQYTVGKAIADNKFHVAVVRTSVTQSIAASIDTMREEIRRTFDELIGSPSNWTEIPINDVIVKCVARVNNMVFYGPELAYNDAYNDNAIKWAMDVVIASISVRNYPNWLKSFAVWFTPIHRRRKMADNILVPIVQQRLDATAKGEPVRDDLMQWLIEAAPPAQKTAKLIAETIIFLDLGSIHSTGLNLSTAVYQLAAEPDKYIPALRQELADVLSTPPTPGQESSASPQQTITKQQLGQLEKMDSFLTESGRLFPFSLAHVSRRVAKPFRFSDGTVIPAGPMIAAPGYVIQRDPEIYENPEDFDGFRFTRQAAGKRMHMVSTSTENLLFGHGRHACPGRFFAVNEMKLILALLLERYDIKLIPGTAPYRAVIGLLSLPESNLKILMRLASSN